MDTLIISATYRPVGCVPWQRAMQLWFSGRAEVIQLYEDRTVRSVHDTYRVPSVLRFGRARPIRRRRVRFSRRNVYARDSGRCQYCREQLSWREATYDHVVPRSRGGGTGWTNIVIACRPCNQFKGARTPEQCGMRLLNPPVQPRNLPAYSDFGLRWSAGMPPEWRFWLPIARGSEAAAEALAQIA